MTVEQWEDYIEKLKTYIPYLNQKNLDKFVQNIVKRQFNNDTFLDYRNLNLGYVSANSLLRQYIEGGNYNNKLFAEYIIGILIEATTNNYYELENKLKVVKEEYKNYCGDPNASIQKDMGSPDFYEILQQVIYIEKTAKDIKEALKIARKQNIELYAKYYFYERGKYEQQTMLDLATALKDSMWGNRMLYVGKSFGKKDAFVMSASSYINMFNNLERALEGLYYKDYNDENFISVKKDLAQFGGFYDENGNRLDVNLPDNQAGINEATRIYIENKIGEVSSFMDDYYELLPRALTAINDKFIVTKKELEECLNPSALMGLKEDYDIFLYLLKSNDIAINVSPDEKDWLLYTAQQFKVDEGLIGDVLKLEDERGEQISLSYANISPEFYDKQQEVEKFSQQLVNDESELEK